jgi:hypothetical protein
VPPAYSTDSDKVADENNENEPVSPQEKKSQSICCLMNPSARTMVKTAASYEVSTLSRAFLQGFLYYFSLSCIKPQSS